MPKPPPLTLNKIRERSGSFIINSKGKFVRGDFVIGETGIENYDRREDSPLQEITLDSLQLGPVLGSGVSSTVRNAVHKETGQEIALKAIKVYEKAKRDQLVNELRTLTQSRKQEDDFLTNDDMPEDSADEEWWKRRAEGPQHIVRLFNAFYKEYTVYIALELMDLGSLESLIRKAHEYYKEKIAYEKKHGRSYREAPGLPEHVIACILRQILIGLEYFHTRANNLHRDLKPANVLLRRDGWVKISDFGHSRHLDGKNRETAHTFVGTLSYLAPERINGSLVSKEDENGQAKPGQNGGGAAGKPPANAATAILNRRKSVGRMGALALGNGKAPTDSPEFSPSRLFLPGRNRLGYSYAADVWSIGLLALECALGQYPFSADCEGESDDEEEQDSLVSPRGSESSSFNGDEEEEESRRGRAKSSSVLGFLKRGRDKKYKKSKVANTEDEQGRKKGVSVAKIEATNETSSSSAEKSVRKLRRNTTGGAISDIKTVRAPTEMELEDRILMAPIPKPPKYFSPAFHEFVSLCLVRDPERRPDVSQLLDKAPLICNAPGPEALRAYVRQLDRDRKELNEDLVKSRERKQRKEQETLMAAIQDMIDLYPHVDPSIISAIVESSEGDIERACAAIEEIVPTPRESDADSSRPKQHLLHAASTHSLPVVFSPPTSSSSIGHGGPASARARQASTPHPLFYQPPDSASPMRGHRRSDSQHSYVSFSEDEQLARALQEEEETESLISRSVLSEEEILQGMERVIIHEYDPMEDDWVRHGGRAKVEEVPFSEGDERRVHRMQVVDDAHGQRVPKEYVAKFFKSETSSRSRWLYMSSVEAQAIAESYAVQFNREMRDRVIGFVEAKVVEFPEKPGSPLGVMEPYFGGTYRKFNDNRGGILSHWQRAAKVPLTVEVSEGHGVENLSPGTAKLASLAQAFSHFTFDRSGGRLVVCDLQGVGNLLTDPQIHSCADADTPLMSRKPELTWNGRFGPGDQGLAGVRAFFRTHVCNEYCKRLLLSSVTIKSEGGLDITDHPRSVPPLLERASSGELWSHFRNMVGEPSDASEECPGDQSRSFSSLASPSRTDVDHHRLRTYQEEDEDEALKRALMESQLLSPSGQEKEEASPLTRGSHDVVLGSSAEERTSGSSPSNREGDNFIEYAKYLGIDPEKEVELLAIAQEGFEAPVPEGWSQHADADGNIYFYNSATGKSTWEHPLDDFYKGLVATKRKLRQGVRS